MRVYFITLLSIAAVELTDKTRIIALVLSVRYQAPFQLVIGMTLGYIPAIALAVLASDFLSGLISPLYLRWIIALSFFEFGIYLLLSRAYEDKEGENKHLARFEHLGPFWMGLILVALTEFMDKSQLATAGLTLKYRTGWPVFLGSISAQALLNIIYVGFGSYLGQRLPVKLIQCVAGAIFILIGFLAIIR
ncbi:MAG: TMEM165/GDT1 family protein [Candidatus Omnitrophica bacterium]|nr:TMEM165/GDT1 family protein [Candidatus Omnitrophota bacterium]